MRRFPPREPPTPPPRDRPPRRDIPRSEGPFDRLLRGRTQRDPAPLIIGGTVLFLAIVILLVFLFSGLLGGDDDDGGQAVVETEGIVGVAGEMPGLPPGLVALSIFVEFETDGDQAANIALPLNPQPEDETGVGFYTYAQARWQRVSDVQLEDEGARAAADFSPVPQNLAVLRVVAQAYQVAASLPAGSTLHPDASPGILSPRDYSPLADGSLGGEASEVEVTEGQLLIPTITGSGEDTAAMVNDILGDDAKRSQHVQEIVQLADSGDFDGIDLEYTQVDPELRSQFSSFARELGRGLRDAGRRLSLTLPPPGPQRQAYDWAALGEAADILKILPIADPVEYWETMPQALNELLDQDIDPQKLMLVVSPFSAEVNDDGEAKTLGYLEAMLLATQIKVREPEDPEKIEPDVGVRFVAANLAQSEGASELAWNNDAAAVSFSYGPTDRRTVYVENVFSVGFKLELVQAYALGGVAVADASAGTDVANVWGAINALIDSGTVTLVQPNGDALIPRWESPDGGQLDAAAGPEVIWRAEEPGGYRMRLILSDGVLRFGQEIEVVVNERALTPTPLVTFGPEPTPTPTPEPTAAPTPTAPPDDTMAPNKITGVTIDNSVAGQFTLTWNPSAAPDLALYRVYASSTVNADFPAEYDLVAEVPKGTTTYTDDEFTLPDDFGTTYYYVITAVDTSDNESVPSNVKSSVLQ
jgi:hypothetical protein